jgi:anaerobic magnesium-protoporphyrin IX monomethyl ester cyclase
MRIAFISPYESIASYGIRLLSTVLKQAGHDTQLVFLPLHFSESYSSAALEAICKAVHDADLVGISLSSNYVQQAMVLTRALKRHNEHPIIWGGIHPTIEPEECLDHADIVCIGEAEATIVELVSKMQEGKEYHTTLGFGFAHEGEKIVNPAGPLVTDLDGLPYPDYDCRRHLILSNERLIPLTPPMVASHLEGHYITMSSRGCVHSCTFCCNNFLKRLYQGDKWFRRRSIPNLIKELEWVKREHPYFTKIYYDDDAFLERSEEEIERFCKAYKEKIGLPLIITGITPLTLTDAKLRSLIDAGLDWVRMGIQTASYRVNRDVYNRAIAHEKTEEAIEIIRRYKDTMSPARYDFVLDNPWETTRENVQTLEFMLRLPRPFAINTCSLTFFPGTELYERAKREGLVSDKMRDVYAKSYKVLRNTYLNRLFMFYCMSRLPTWVLRLFINRFMLATRLNYPLWYGYVACRELRQLARKLSHHLKQLVS